MTRKPLYKTLEGQQILAASYDRLFARWPVRAETRTVETRHGPTFVIACGNPTGSPFLLLHGASSNALMWMTDVAELGRLHRVYAIDIIGEPGRSAPNRLPWDGSAYSDWLTDVADGLGLVTVRLIALSQGGWIALKFAATQPDRVDKLVLLSPAGVIGDRSCCEYSRCWC